MKMTMWTWMTTKQDLQRKENKTTTGSEEHVTAKNFATVYG